jgi:N-acetylglucosamine malate deacetylase 1
MDMNSIARILILSPHTDDGEISAGGTIARFIDEGKEVYYAGFSYCEKSVDKCYPPDILKFECIEALNELGLDKKNIQLFNFEVRVFQDSRQEILDAMILMGKEIQPDLVICPSSFDVHQDHKVINNESTRAFKKESSIWGMEHPWNNLSFRTDIFVELNENCLQKKIDSLKKYPSQSSRDYFREEYIRACAYVRGMNVGVKYAETFECIRLKL